MMESLGGGRGGGGADIFGEGPYTLKQLRKRKKKAAAFDPVPWPRRVKQELLPDC